MTGAWKRCLTGPVVPTSVRQGRGAPSLRAREARDADWPAGGDRLPSELSGRQQQRVAVGALARARAGPRCCCSTSRLCESRCENCAGERAPRRSRYCSSRFRFTGSNVTPKRTRRGRLPSPTHNQPSWRVDGSRRRARLTSLCTRLPSAVSWRFSVDAETSSTASSWRATAGRFILRGWRRPCRLRPTASLVRLAATGPFVLPCARHSYSVWPLLLFSLSCCTGVRACA